MALVVTSGNAATPFAVGIEAAEAGAAVAGAFLPVAVAATAAGAIGFMSGARCSKRRRVESNAQPRAEDLAEPKEQMGRYIKEYVKALTELKEEIAQQSKAHAEALDELKERIGQQSKAMIDFMAELKELMCLWAPQSPAQVDGFAALRKLIDLHEATMRVSKAQHAKAAAPKQAQGDTCAALPSKLELLQRFQPLIEASQADRGGNVHHQAAKASGMIGSAESPMQASQTDNDNVVMKAAAEPSGGLDDDKAIEPATMPFDKRSAEARMLLARYPGRCPVIIEKAPRSDLPDINRRKFLVQGTMTYSDFKHIVRKHINRMRTASVEADQMVYLLANGTPLKTGALMSEVYEQHKADDGFMYMTYSAEDKVD